MATPSRWTPKTETSPSALTADSSRGGERQVDQVYVDGRLGAAALVVRNMAVAFARQEHRTCKLLIDRLSPRVGRGRVTSASDEKDRRSSVCGDRAHFAGGLDRPVCAHQVGVLKGGPQKR